MNNVFEGHSFWLANDGTEIEICNEGETDCLIEMTHTDNTTEMRSVNKFYIKSAIEKGSLKPKKIENWLIKRSLDNKYYKGSNIWTEDWTEALIFPNDKVEKCIDAFNKHGYQVKKIVR